MAPAEERPPDLPAAPEPLPPEPQRSHRAPPLPAPQLAGTGNRRPRPEVSAPRRVATVALILVATVAFGLACHLLVVSHLRHRAAQQSAFDRLRKELALGTAPVGATDRAGRLWPLGKPVALIDIPSLDVHEVVLEGTTGSVLQGGPGHRRDSVFPGQVGTSVVYGRQASYGGPFGHLGDLRTGATIRVTTGQGKATYRVIGRRRAGDLAPAPPESDGGRLVLATATGTPYSPSGVLRIDADLVGKAFPAAKAVDVASRMTDAEMIMVTDSSMLWALVLWLQALLLAAVGAVWSWYRWGRHQTWIVFVPLTLLIALAVADQVSRLLPNLL